MGVIPLRGNSHDEGRREQLDAQLQDLEQRLKALQIEEERIRGLEQTLLDASTHRIHDFERRLEHEWLALRELHEEQLKTSLVKARVEPAALQPSRTVAILAMAAFAALTALGIYSWRLGSQARGTTARLEATEGKVTELQALVDRQAKESQQTVQRLTADALTSAARAERLANVLAASDVRLYPMRGQLTAAAASGQIFFSPTRGIALTGAGLTVPPANHIYQVWLTTTRGPISLGFASPDGQGRISGAYEAPPELAGNIIGFMLTTEPVGGSPRPTGLMALGT
jgi:hypothetical protein